jgi:hypothetical protein
LARFDDYGSPLVQYKVHHPMQLDQGYSSSHWVPASGNYLLHIAPAAARATGKQTTINTYTSPKKLAVLMAAAVRRYNTAHIAL